MVYQPKNAKPIHTNGKTIKSDEMEKIKYSGEDLYPYERTAVECQPKEKITFKSIKCDNGVAQQEDNIVEVESLKHPPYEGLNTVSSAWIDGKYISYYPSPHVEYPTLADAGIKIEDFYTADVPIPGKYALTIKEAVAYFGIGERKLRKLVDANKSDDWFLMNGTKILIKRKKFEKYLDEATYI